MPDLSTDTLTGRSVLRGVAVFAWATWLWSTIAPALTLGVRIPSPVRSEVPSFRRG